MLDIIFVQARSEMGITKPFIAQAANGKSYVVKTLGMMPINQLLSEFIGTTLAIRMNLPCPNYQFAKFNETVYSLIQPEWKRYLSPITAFASEYVADTVLAKTTQANNPHYLSENEQKWLYMFDRWILNSDRTASKIGTGNINLLFDEQKQQILVIDHNLAFDEKAQFNEHLFAPENREWRLERKDKADFTQKAIEVLGDFEYIYQSIPDDWFPIEDEAFQRVEININAIKTMLARIKDKHYWEGIE